jgi:hypothetical protein
MPSVYPLVFGAFLCLFVQLPGAAQVHPRGHVRAGSIAGRVTVRQAPAPGVEVQLLLLDATSSKRTPVTKVMTDEAGRYRFAGLAAGQYDVLPAAPTLVVPKEGRYGQPGKSVTIQSGEATPDIDFDLVPAERITGRVIDVGGQPVSGEAVTLSLAGEGGYLRPFVPPDSRQVSTDKAGAYRVDGVPPGRYLVSVGEDYDLSTSGAGGRSRYSQTFHPASAEAPAAVAVEVPGGGEVTGVDITVGSPLRAFRMAGRVVDVSSGLPLPGVKLRVIILDEEGHMRRDISADWRSGADGGFSIEGARPGRYLIRPQDDAASNTYGEPLALEIKDADTVGLEIKMLRGSSIAGTVVVEGEGGQAGVRPSPGLGLMAHVSEDGAGPAGVTVAKINDDGSFRIRGLRPGRVALQLRGLVSGATQEFSILGVETVEGPAVNGGLRVGSGEEITGLRVTLGRGTGVLRGEVKVEGGALDGVQLYALYRREGDAPGSYRNAQLDARGRFIIEKLVAGDYEVMVGPMSLYVTGETGAKTMSRLPTVKRQVTLPPGGAAEVTLVLALRL